MWDVGDETGEEGRCVCVAGLRRVGGRFRESPRESGRDRVGQKSRCVVPGAVAGAVLCCAGQDTTRHDTTGQDGDDWYRYSYPLLHYVYVGAQQPSCECKSTAREFRHSSCLHRHSVMSTV